MGQIKNFLEQHALTQREAAIRLGVSEAYLSRIINAKSPITNSFRGVFAQTFGFDAAQQIFNQEPQEQPEVAQ